MSGFEKVYTVTLASMRRQTKKSLSQSEAAYKSLKCKDSTYAKAIKQMMELHRKAYEVYRDAPDNIV
jgi:rubrerythrin